MTTIEQLRRLLEETPSRRIAIIKLLKEISGLSISDNVAKSRPYYYNHQMVDDDGYSIVDTWWDIEGLYAEYGLQAGGIREVKDTIDVCFDHYGALGYETPHDACIDAIFRLKMKVGKLEETGQ